MRRQAARLLAGVAGLAGPALVLAFAAGADRPKRGIEMPTKELVSRTAGGDASANPRVSPGKVRWHADLSAACRAAGKSGKPVLLFQLMGRLDRKFC